MKRRVWIAVVTLVALVQLVSAWGGMFHPSHVPLLVPLLTLAFPVVTLLTLLTLCVALLLRRWREAAIPVAALLMSAPMLWLTCPVHTSVPLTAEQETFKLLTINVQGMWQTDTLRPDSTMAYILASGADVVMVQEFPHDDANRPFEQKCPAVKWLVPALDSIYPYRSHTNDDVAILSRYPFTSTPVGQPLVGFETMDYYFHMRHHYAMAYDVQMPHGRQLRVINVHLHSWTLTRQNKRILGGDTVGEMAERPHTPVYGLSTRQKLRRAFRLRAEEAHAVRQAIDRSPANVVVCGDFNDVPGSYVYRTVSGADMNDAWSAVGSGYAPTFMSYRFYVRIDHVLYRGGLHPVSARCERAPRTDHRPVLVDFVWD